jgi:APA family basic amino acid/polyamine antiporter
LQRGPGLARELGALDTALITMGATLGSAVFLTAGSMARALPRADLLVALWVAGGGLTLAGALTYAELSAMFPRAGGPYQFLKEAYGPLVAFLYGWASFLVMQSGGIAALAVAFGEYLGVFVPFFSSQHALFSLRAGATVWTVSGGQVAGVAAIAVLSAINCLGVKEGARVQNVVTGAKVVALLALAGVGLFAHASPAPAGAVAPPAPGLASGIGVAMIAVFWTYDGWYSATFSAGEVRRPGRNLPLGIALGTVGLMVLYVSVNLAYLRVLPMSALAASNRVAEDAARVIFGPGGASFISALVLLSIFGCIASSILTASRIYLPMAEDGVFFSRLARVHPRYRTPVPCIVAQALWASVLVFSGSYEQLFTYVVVAGLLFHTANGVALFVLRRKLPERERPYPVWGYPWLPAVFILTSIAAVASALVERPVESALGVGLVLAGLPGYLYWRSRSGSAAQPGTT